MKHSEKEKIRQSFLVKPGSKVDLTHGFKLGINLDEMDKETARNHLEEDIKRIAEQQDILYAQNNYSLLIIFQAMDAAGKDGTIKHVMSGINPQGCQVYSFKAPSEEELDHDYLWRCNRALPERGRIGIFNRSYYEEVLVARVHPSILASQPMPPEMKGKGIWKKRFEQINNYEKYLVENGTVILKFFLNVSKAEQKNRFLARLTKPEKNWKFSASDALDRQHWDEYIDAYEDALSQTSTEVAPWYVIPADHKPFCRLSVGYIIAEVLKSMDLKYPTVSEEHKKELLKAKAMLEAEDGGTGSDAALADDIIDVAAEPVDQADSSAPAKAKSKKAKDKSKVKDKSKDKKKSK